MSKPKYKRGLQIWSLDSLARQENIYWYDRLWNRKWFMNLQMQLIVRAINNGTIYYALERDNGYEHSERQCVIAPDIQCDFTDLPFADDTFSLVIFDPPHLERAGENSWMRKKYGVLSDNWPQMLHDGFRECMRVLKPDGVLIFKWSEVQIEAKKVWEAIGEKPLFGHRSGKNAKTFWGCFMKLGLPEAPEVE